MIVLEGVDRGGKSALARELQRWHTGPSIVYHQGPPPPTADLVELYERPLLDPAFQERALDPDDLVILDRWETGELVYGPLFRGKARLTPGQALHVDLVLRSLGAVRVLAQPRNVAVVKQRHMAHGDDLLAYHDIEKVHAFYEDVARIQGWVRGSAFIDHETVASDPSDLLSLAEHETLYVCDLQCYPGYVGHRHPRVLFVGERRANTRTGEPLPWTDKAFTPVGGLGCSRWLLDALHSVNLLNVGLVNAYEPYQDLLALWQALDEPRVVALGNLASAELRRWNIVHRKTVHPQYARRFRHKDFAWYAAALESAAREDKEARDGDTVRV